MGDGSLNERDMFFWSQKDLDGLPTDEAADSESGHGGGVEIVGGGLKSVSAAYG